MCWSVTGRETFNERLRRRWQEARTLLCVGLDGEIERMPEQFRRGLALGETNGNSADERERRIEAALTEYHIAIVEATADLVCAYKPNIAFYEQHGPAGLRALYRRHRLHPKKYPEIPVLLDAKRGDIGSTSQAYARALFDIYGADAVTAHPTRATTRWSRSSAARIVASSSSAAPRIPARASYRTSLCEPREAPSRSTCVSREHGGE